MLNRTKLTSIALCALVFALAGLPRECKAIPYFARKYHTTCLRCHTAPPKLNAFGKNFQMYGYQQPGDLKTNKQEVPEDKNLSLLDQAPLALFVENGVDGNRFVNRGQTPFTLQSPVVFHLFAADTIGPNLGFFGELATAGGSTDVGKVTLTSAFLGGTNVHLQVGNLDPVEHGVTEHDLFTRVGYSIQDMDVGGVNLANQHMGVRLYGTIGSTVTRAVMHGGDKTSTPDNSDSGAPPETAPEQTPVQSNKGTPAGDPRIDAIEQQMRKLQQELDDLKKSRKQPDSQGKGGGSTNQSEQGGSTTNHGPFVYGQDSQAQDKAGAKQKPKDNKKSESDQGDQSEDESDPLNKLQGLLWEVGFYNSNAVGNSNGIATTRDAGDFSARLNAYFNGDSFIGLFGFGGRTTVPDPTGNTLTNNYRMGGADISYSFGRSFEKTPGMPIKEYNLLASYLTGTSDNPNGDGIKANYNGYFVELERVFGGRAMGSVKYERVHAGNLANLDANAGMRDNALSLNYTYYLRTNFWMGLEYTRDLNRHGTNHALGLIFDFAF